MLRKHIKVRLAVLIAAAAISLGLVSAVAMAHGNHGNVPSPYTGLKNPLPWTDATAQAQGKALYQKTCAGCHGANGSNQAVANFAVAGASDEIQADADYYFWVTSEGNLTNGMPSFKSGLSEPERWQIITYLATLSNNPQAGASGPATPILGGGPMFPGPAIAMSIDDSSPTPGVQLVASLTDPSGKPVSGQTVQFFLKKNFFASDSMLIGEVDSNNQGKAVLDYLPSEDGTLQFSAQWANLEAPRSLTVKSKSKSYQTVAGLRLPALGPEVAIGLDVAQAEMGFGSPTGGLRLPGGTFSWLLLFVAVIILIWATYFRVFRMVWHIPEADGCEGLTVRLVPVMAICFVLFVGLTLALVILHGPYTHLHLGR
ncbi:MAG: c-type cytochrome [Dehalococcoidales bacterium]|nr:c-type cytochrome [Dehalococcoidales bacterium]